MNAASVIVLLLLIAAAGCALYFTLRHRARRKAACAGCSADCALRLAAYRHQEAHDAGKKQAGAFHAAETAAAHTASADSAADRRSKALSHEQVRFVPSDGSSCAQARRP